MKKNIKTNFCCLGVIVLLCLFFILKLSQGIDFIIFSIDSYRHVASFSSDKVQVPSVIAHAGGHFRGRRLTNSKEALDCSAQRNKTFVEVDLNWTRDGQLVLIHDWDSTWQTYYQRYEIPSLEEFVHWTKSQEQIFTAMTWNDLVLWMQKHPDVYIVTDIKNKNIEALRLIKSNLKALNALFLTDRIIPQIYQFQEYIPMRDLGYKHVILTLYRSHYPNTLVQMFAAKVPLVAITMPKGRARSELPQKLFTLGVPSFVHTINDRDEWKLFKNHGITGVYSDFL